MALKCAELRETQMVEGQSWFKVEMAEPDKPLMGQLAQFLSENEGIKIVSTALSDKTTGFFIKVRVMTMVIIYDQANPS